MNAELKFFDKLDSFSLSGKGIHLAIGMFDGLHLGHAAVVESAKSAIAESGGLAGVLTFWPHASRLFRPESPVPMILAPDRKMERLKMMDMDFVIQQPFNAEFAQEEPSVFVDRLVSAIPGLASIHVGENWRFGSKRKGDVAMLKQLAGKHGVKVNSLVRISQGGEAVSSTRIRGLLGEGNVSEANELLGYRYYTNGVVVEGKKLGRTIGFPTLNLHFDEELKPKFGVYAVSIKNVEGGQSYCGVANFGIRPTVETGQLPLLETNVFDECPFDYGSHISVEWIRFIRPEMKFNGLDELKAQIAKDADEAKVIHNGLRSGE